MIVAAAIAEPTISRADAIAENRRRIEEQNERVAALENERDEALARITGEIDQAEAEERAAQTAFEQARRRRRRLVLQRDSTAQHMDRRLVSLRAAKVTTPICKTPRQQKLLAEIELRLDRASKLIRDVKRDTGMVDVRSGRRKYKALSNRESVQDYVRALKAFRDHVSQLAVVNDAEIAHLHGQIPRFVERMEEF